MEQQAKKQIAQSIQDFQLPLYTEIPNVGLFLEQTTKFVSEYFETMPGITITSSMISNYVKKGIIKNPVKKQYARDEIAYLFFIAISKSVLSLENIQELLLIQALKAASRLRSTQKRSIADAGSQRHAEQS